MAGPILNTPITVVQGSDEVRTFSFFTQPTGGSTDVQDLVPVNFTGCTARMQVRATANPGGTAYLSLAGGAGVSGSSPSGIAFIAETFSPGPPLPGSPNGFTVTVSKEKSLAMNGGQPGIFYYDLILDWTNGTSTVYLRGQFTLQGSATR